ncbi:33394_t:CDS:1, partial [Racocetra persica]
YTSESQQFRVQLRKTRFLNPQNDNRKFESLEGEYLLSEQLKKFGNLVCERRIVFIKKTFENNKPSLLRPIPVTEQEEEAAMSKEKISKAELLTTINSLLASINISDRSKYHGLRQKNCNQLREILQSIRDLQDN